MYKVYFMKKIFNLFNRKKDSINDQKSAELRCHQCKKEILPLANYCWVCGIPFIEIQLNLTQTQIKKIKTKVRILYKHHNQMNMKWIKSVEAQPKYTYSEKREILNNDIRAQSFFSTPIDIDKEIDDLSLLDLYNLSEGRGIRSYANLARWYKIKPRPSRSDTNSELEFKILSEAGHHPKDEIFCGQKECLFCKNNKLNNVYHNPKTAQKRMMEQHTKRRKKLGGRLPLCEKCGYDISRGGTFCAGCGINHDYT